MKHSDKQKKAIFDIRPVLVSKKVREIIKEKKESEKKILSPLKSERERQPRKIFFKKVVDLKAVQEKKRIPILKSAQANSVKVKESRLLRPLINQKYFEEKKGNFFDIKLKEKLPTSSRKEDDQEKKETKEAKAKLSTPQTLTHNGATSRIEPLAPLVKGSESFLGRINQVFKKEEKSKPNIQTPRIFGFYQALKQKLFSFRLIILKRSFGVFIVISFFLMSSIQSLAFFHKDLIATRVKILDETNVAYQYLLSGQNSILEKDFDLASYKFNVAAERFISAQKELNRVNDTITRLLKIIPGGSVVSSGKNLLEAGANIAFASKCLAEALEPFSKTEDIFAEIKKVENKENLDKTSFTFALAETFENFQLAQKNLKEAEKNLEKVDPNDFPEEVRVDVSKIKIALPVMVSGLDYFVSHVDILFEILGHNKPKKYLLLFENNRELRPSGGFIGTYGLFDMKEGKIENLKVEGPYAIDGQLKEIYTAPEPLRLIQPRFFMHDANWFLDFPMSARKIILLHEKTGGPTVDGVIVFTAVVMQDLLKIVGPIEMPEYRVTITADNFYDETQREVELDYDKELNEPKKFIADLLPRFFEKIASQDKKKWADVANVFLKELTEKQILIYFADEELENFVREAGFAGEVKTSSKDYLSVVASNIGGGKTDHAIEQQISHFSEIQPDGSIIDTVKIKRKHNGDKNSFWTSIKNVCFLRVYVPQGSKLIEASGFDSQFYDVLVPPIEGSIPDPLVDQIEKGGFIHEPSKVRITQEGSKTVFGNFVGIEVGQEKEVILKYQLPFKILLSDEHAVKNYSLFFQKQPGTPSYKFSSELFYPQNFNLIWRYPQGSDLSLKNGSVRYETNLETDKIYAAVFKDKFSK